jgi:amidase
VAAPRIAFFPGHAARMLEESTLSLLERTAEALARAGATVSRASLPQAVLAAAEAQPVVMQGETRQALAWELRAAPEKLSEGLRERMEWADSLPTGALSAARGTLAAARDAYADFMADYDLVLTPSAPGEAPLGLEATGDPVCNLLWTALHAPCVTLPAGAGPNGMPLGVQVVGKIGGDAGTLALAEWVAAALG